MELMDPQPVPYAQGKLVDCRYCGSTGVDHEANHVGILDIGSHRKPCPVCHGTGYQRI